MSVDSGWTVGYVATPHSGAGELDRKGAVVTMSRATVREWVRDMAVAGVWSVGVVVLIVLVAS